MIPFVSSFRRVPRGGIEAEQYDEMGHRIALIQLAQMNDRWVWSLTGNGEFFVKSVRNLVDDFLLSLNMLPMSWEKEIPIKINVFAWKVQNSKLPTSLNLSRIGIEIHSISCSNCEAPTIF
ncbi:RNA-directed DNA polymerase, eukaryota [Tanacetum coccineum]